MPADLFYEWQIVAGQKTKQPWCIRLPDEEPFCMAALWERWHPKSDPEAEPLLSCCILTTDANATMAPIHDRMPVIVHPEDYAAWLDPHTTPAAAQRLVRPYEGPMTAYRVSTLVNAPRHDDPRCAEPLPADA
jgi:putative SOS response-associated peptidase YedK